MSSTCAGEGCEVELGSDNRSGFCVEHLPRQSRPRRVSKHPARAEAEKFVLAWLRADYEPDDVGAGWMSERSVEKLITRVADLMAGQLLRAPVPDRKAPPRDVITIGTPRELSADHADDPDARAPSCPAYTLCLAHVVTKGWKVWTCRGCLGPGVTAAHQGKEPGEAPDEHEKKPDGRRGARRRRMKYEDKGWG